MADFDQNVLTLCEQENDALRAKIARLEAANQIMGRALSDVRLAAISAAQNTSAHQQKVCDMVSNALKASDDTIVGIA